MENYQLAFIKLALECGALKFGEFTLKSGRKSPYFFNAGVFRTGKALHALGQHYSTLIQKEDIAFDGLFGPAYKGIPLACACAMALAQDTHQEIPFSFNRKEPKTHGEGGLIIGAPLEGNILIIDDVITAGTAKKEAIQLIHAHQAKACGIIIALDRQEKASDSERSTVQLLQESEGIPVFSLIQLAHIVQYLHTQKDMKTTLAHIEAYRSQYGA